MNDTHPQDAREPRDSEDADHGPAGGPESGIVSVNSRGGTSNNMAGKLVFVVLVFAVLMIGGLFAVNKWRSMAREKDAAQASADKNVNRPAQVGVRRTFDTDPPPTPPPAPKPDSTAAAKGIVCPDNMPGTVLLGPDGKALVTPHGIVMRVCNNGQVIVPAVSSAPQVVDSNPAPQSSSPPPSRYGGDVLVASRSSLSGGSDASTSDSTRTPNPVTTGLLSDLLAKTQATGSTHLMGGTSIPGTGGDRGAGPPASPNGSIGSMLAASHTPAMQAGKLGDRSMVLPRGRQVDCSLSTRTVSEISGMATCVLSSNVYSANGRVLLLEKGSVATGEYGSAMTQGQRRLFVLWTRVETPAGVVVNLNSPAGDSLGTTGLDGYVDNHWWERIGSAFMLSLVQDAVASWAQKESSASNSSTGNEQGVLVLQNSQQTSTSLAQKVLENSINIKPTLYKNQGDRASIFVARDLDFSTVYALRAH